MGDSNNVFISWSGGRSKAAAEALRSWLPIVLQSARPWMSDTDIEKGSRGLEEVGKALEGMSVGIICLTPENLTEPWVLYEAGALSKTLDAKTRVCTYLLAGLRKRDVKPPLGLFQATEAEMDDTRKLVHTVNKSLEGPRVPEENLNRLFDAMWPQLADKLAKLPAATAATAPKRTVDDMVAEILELSRSTADSSRSLVEVVRQDVNVLAEEVFKLEKRFEPLRYLIASRSMGNQSSIEPSAVTGMYSADAVLVGQKSAVSVGDLEINQERVKAAKAQLLKADAEGDGKKKRGFKL